MLFDKTREISSVFGKMKHEKGAKNKPARDRV